MNFWYSLVDLLPFEWAQSGSMLFMKNALLAILVISPLFGFMSTMVVQSRMTLLLRCAGPQRVHRHGHRRPVRSWRRRPDAPWCCRWYLPCCSALVRRRSASGQRHRHRRILLHRRGAWAFFIATLGGRSFHQIQQPVGRRHSLRLPRQNRPAGPHSAGSRSALW